ncbi:hypothetical protein IWW51_004848 [Coemansia sp. RSA 2702]|nr:hypothetical protein IWW51_004848 [Coemansia sp. RSA 2702]
MSNSSKDSSPEAGGRAHEASDIVQGLSSTAQTIGSSLQAMQQALVGNMQQAAQMTLSMNQMMEELVKRSVQLRVFAERAAAARTTTLRVTVHNRSPIPLQQARVKLWFGARQPRDQPIRLKVGGAGAPDDVLVFEHIVKQLPAEFADEDAPFTATEQAVNIGSGASAEASVAVEVGTLGQLNGRIAVEFVSPGTGQLLAVGHRFGIHLLQLLDCSFAHDQAAVQPANGGLHPLPDAQPIEVDIGRVRTQFSVPPAQGISPGCLLVLSTKSNQLALHIISIADDAQTATCKWMASGPAPDLLAVLPQLTEELCAQTCVSK